MQAPPGRSLRIWVSACVVASVVMLASCAGDGTFYERVTRENGTHFATWNHLGYSVSRATPQDTKEKDLAMAADEKWFGKIVRVEPIQ